MKPFDKRHSIYERQYFQRLIKFFRELASAITFGLITEANAQSVISLYFSERKLRSVLENTHLSIGERYGEIVGKQLNKSFASDGWKKPLFSQRFQKDVIKYYDDFGGEKITLLSDTYTKAVISEIKKATELGESLDQMQKRVKKAVNSPKFYKAEALRIARTETTMAMNFAKQVSGEVSGFVMEKVWSAKIDGRERPSHRSVDKTAVDQNGLFNVGGEKMSYPGDRLNGASASNIVNCRCSYGYRGKRDKDGKLIYVDI